MCKELHGLMKPEWQDKQFQNRTEICTKTSWPLVHEWALTLGAKYDRYKLDQPVRPIYRSKTCEVYFAKDVKCEPPKPVCIKMIRDQINFESELDSRNAVALDPKYVVEVLENGFLKDEETREFRKNNEYKNV